MTFCLSDPLLKYVLGQVEKSPQATFTEAELRRVSSGEFEGLVKARLLRYKRSDPDQETFPCPTPCDKGCDRGIGKIGGVYQAICQGHSDVSPIPLTEGDLNRYAFDIDRLLAMIGKKNQLVGLTHAINDRVLFVGERIIGENHLVGVFLAFLGNRREAELILSGLSGQIGAHNRTLVLLPLCDRISQGVLRNLESQDIVVIRFEEVFPKSDLAIDFAMLERRRPQKRFQHLPITPRRQSDYDKYEYLCKDELRITGKGPKERSNWVRVNDRVITVPDNEMLLLLYLVMELKKLDGGWVDRERLGEEGITEEDFPYRSIGRLRKTLAPGLSDGNGERFIENKGDRSYRISTHPDFVIIEKRDWLVKKYDELKEAIREERKKRESDRRKREEEEIKRALSKQK